MYRDAGHYTRVKQLVNEQFLSDRLSFAIEFPTENAMCDFMSDPDYAPYAEARKMAAESQLIGIDATDAAGTIPYLAPEAR